MKYFPNINTQQIKHEQISTSKMNNDKTNFSREISDTIYSIDNTDLKLKYIIQFNDLLGSDEGESYVSSSKNTREFLMKKIKEMENCPEVEENEEIVWILQSSWIWIQRVGLYCD